MRDAASFAQSLSPFTALYMGMTRFHFVIALPRPQPGTTTPRPQRAIFLFAAARLECDTKKRDSDDYHMRRLSPRTPKLFLFDMVTDVSLSSLSGFRCKASGLPGPRRLDIYDLILCFSLFAALGISARESALAIIYLPRFGFGLMARL